MNLRHTLLAYGALGLLLSLVSCEKQDRLEQLPHEPQDTAHAAGATLQFYAVKTSARPMRGIAWKANDAVGVYAFTSGEPIATATPLRANTPYITLTNRGFFAPKEAASAIALEGSRKVDIVAYYPWQSAVDGDLTIAIDLANTAADADPDLLVSSNVKGITRETPMPTLQFTHVLARITVRAASATSSTKLSLEGFDVDGNYSLRTGKLELGAANPKSIPMRALGEGLYEAIVLPGQKMQAGKLVIVENGMHRESALTLDAIIAAGQEYTFTLNEPSSGIATRTAYKEIPLATAPTANTITVTHRAQNSWFANGASSGDRRNYSICYSTRHHLPLWVAYPLYADCMGNVSRTERWVYDPQIPESYQVDLSSSYGQSNISRGHMLMSRQRNASRDLNATTFYYTNMVPQNTTQNGKQWLELENKQVVWAKDKAYDTLYTVCGPVFEGSVSTFRAKDGKQVAMPSHIYKVMLRQHKRSGKWYTLAVKMANSASAPEWGNCIVPIQQLEKELGMDFFPNVPNAEDAGSSSNLSHWN